MNNSFKPRMLWVLGRIVAVKTFAICMILFCLVNLNAEKMHLKPHGKPIDPRKHPHIDALIQTGKPLQSYASKGLNYEKLLVILVDFQEEVVDDPNTTGNGKFRLTPDPEYLYSVGAPPHDRQYYETNLEAMKYYYSAVSAGSYLLQYDVWPKNKPAYTLPKPMGYYNPPGASSSIFVSRMEEYFKAAFELADVEDPTIDFGAYGHFMIIHAGSDWQHDVNGDTPSDIPSFFIRVGDGKQAVVDNGAVSITHACNVPATISQDFKAENDGGTVTHSGYGALNAVLFHEFGHSLGLVDLYNVRNFTPMVGSFDIMDSGGSGLLVDTLPNGDQVLVEGVLPTLPGAFSRMLLFEDFFRSQGYLRTIDESLLFNDSVIVASSARQTGTRNPTLYKIPINDKEYYLIENRNPDPDGDGGTAVFGALDGRVILYPTAFDDPNDVPTYEYDYLLPSFVSTNGDAVGGGLLVWHVNNEVLYDEGMVTDDNSFRSNFDNNTVNTNINRRGVRILEADGLNDLGEQYSMYWTGTPYEYFHARKPVLNGSGAFVRWSSTAWRPKLSSSTDPALLDSRGLGSIYSLHSISDPASVMTFSTGIGFFDNTQVVDFPFQSATAAPIINTNYSDLAIPILSTAGLNILSSFGIEWQDLMGTYGLATWNFDFPQVTSDVNEDGFKELVGVNNNILVFTDCVADDVAQRIITFPDRIRIQPLNSNGAVFLASETTLYKVQNFSVSEFKAIADTKNIAAWDSKLLVITPEKLLLMNANDLSVLDTVELPESFGCYEPVVFKYADETNAQVFIMADSGNLYQYNSGIVSKLFTNTTEVLPTQMGLVTDGARPIVFFGLDKYIYGFYSNGIQCFMHYIDKAQIQAKAHVRAMQLGLQTLLYIPITQQGYMAINMAGINKPNQAFSMLYPQTGKLDYLMFDDANDKLVWYYPIENGRLLIHQYNVSNDPILWNGFRNSGSGVWSREFVASEDAVLRPFDAYIYPNPIRGNLVRLRLESMKGKTSYDVYDISGTKVMSKKILPDSHSIETEFDSSRLSSGVYIMQIKSGNSNKTLKFAVEK